METFRRYEKKYLLEQSQYLELMDKLKDRISKDKFFEADIRSIYYDTKKFELIRRSIEKPEYKEKLRIRSYNEPKVNDLVFVELKKKLDGIVYKRRTKAYIEDVLNDIYECQFKDPQVGEEIKYALNYYDHLKPAVYIGCNRTSYVANDDRDLRITFDKDVRYRMKHLDLKASKDDKPVTEKIIMELKVRNAMPLWLTEALDEVKAYPRGFSKVGTAFLKEIRGE
ncbi:MAG: polyphosphate polymerase domain-containing protein [Erysipelotrichaceae bacterium]|nr:polyphosphate polymerase domain-containing protein [Erysipelotrichaceae bacterium]